MGIEKVVNKHKKREEQPDKVYTNTELDELRREECLCLNCDRKNEEQPYKSCPVAGKLYKICVEHDMAMAITRCGATDEEGNLLYRLYPKYLELVEPKYHKDFIQLMETGDTSEEFYEYADSNKQCQKAIEKAFARQIAALQQMTKKERKKLIKRLKKKK